MLETTWPNYHSEAMSSGSSAAIRPVPATTCSSAIYSTTPSCKRCIPINSSLATPPGVMGDTGNAAGSPQLHVEMHYPIGSSFVCAKCSPERQRTAIVPYASLLRAASRTAAPAAPAPATITAGQPQSGTLTGQSGGAFASYLLANAVAGPRTVTLTYQPFGAGQAHAIGCTIYLCSCRYTAVRLRNRFCSRSSTTAVTSRATPSR